MAAPTLISYTEVAAWNTGGTSKSLASISYQVDDVVIVIAGDEGGGALGTPNNLTGLTFATQKSNNAASTCASLVSAAVATQASSGVLTISNSGSPFYGFAAWVWRGSAGIGNSVEQHTATKTVSLTPAGGANAAICWAIFDFNVEAAHTITPSPTNTRQAVQIASHYTIHVADLADQTSAGAVSYGISGGSSTGPYSIVAIEVMAGAGGGGGDLSVSFGTLGEPVVGGSTF